MGKKHVFILLLIVTIQAGAQCLTDFTKLLPEPSADYSSGFGHSVAMYNEFMAVSIPSSDSLGRLTGIVYLYEEVNGIWKKIASMAPSDPLDALQFGQNVALSQNYLLVSTARYGGMVYIFKKGTSGWKSQTEISKLQVPDSYYFGANAYGNNPMDISEDEQTIVITDYMKIISNTQPRYMGEVYVYHKESSSEWNNSIVPTTIRAPVADVTDFGRTGVIIKDNYLVTGSPYGNDGTGNLYIYQDSSGDFSNFTFEATLNAGGTNFYYLGGSNLVFNEDGIFNTATQIHEGYLDRVILFFETPNSGSWEDTAPTCIIMPEASPTLGLSPHNLLLSTNGTDLLASKRNEDGSGIFNLIKKGPDGWCEPVYQTIDQTQLQPGQLTSYYGNINASNQNTDAVLGYFPLPDNVNASLALKTFKKDGTGWNSELLYNQKKSTAGHYYGSTVFGYDNHLFVTAPGDGTVKSGGGAVYYYEKDATGWGQKNKFLSPHATRYDDRFGSAIASNKKYLAIGASGYEPHGRVFIYEKGTNDWQNASLSQEIELPEDELIIYLYGDNLAMNDEWLVIPYVQNSPFRIMLAFYQFDGTKWNYFQVVEGTGLGSFFSRFSTVSVSIDGETLLAGNLILERNEEGLWGIRYILSPSDPEFAQIAPDFSHWVSNGSLFGQTSTIEGNTIYIGAPAKDYLGKWDVGAVYVYTKRPDEPWSSRTENAKILPRVKEERELFGYAMKSFGNTLLVGAPGSDYNKDGITARNKPGRAYVFQSKDYYWQDIVPLIDFTGDSFVKDYFGINVYMDQSDFFIGASIEDVAGGNLSGSVYVTPSPPIIKFVPPVCFADETIDLFGYPFGGTWSGPGIIDAAEGIFDPKVAGVGTHEFRYITPSCTYEGILRVEIKTPPIAQLTVDTELKVCAGTPVNLLLSAESYPNTYYSWYYKSNDSNTFLPLGNYSATMQATKRGNYQLKVYNDVCQVYTPVITISDEQVEIEVPDGFRLCKNSLPVTLTASPVGGVWQGEGMLNNVFSPDKLTSGVYTIAYEYTSSIGCLFSEDVEVVVTDQDIPKIIRTEGNLCNEGFVTLSINETLTDDFQIEWMRMEESNLIALSSGESVNIDKSGIYFASINTDVCNIISEPYEVNDQISITMTPEGSTWEICSGESAVLAANKIEGADYTWLFSALKDAQYSVSASSTNSIQITQSGYYQLEVQQGLCEFLSEPKHVFVHPPDSIFVPNVFTPNGDGKNDFFKVSGNLDNGSLLILNRYGKTVFNGDISSSWSGEDLSTGVYYWFIQYSTCGEASQTLRGDVQLIR